MRFVNFIFAILLALAPSAWAGESLAENRALFQRALDGNPGALETALRSYAELAAGTQPAAVLHQAYLGAAQTLQGRDAWLPWEKLRATEKGLATIEKALRRLDARPDPADGTSIALETRLVAISTYLAIPVFFNRTDSARQLLREALAHPAFASAPGDLRAALYRQAAVLAARDGKPAEEGEYLRKAAALDAGVRS